MNLTINDFIIEDPLNFSRDEEEDQVIGRHIDYLLAKGKRDGQQYLIKIRILNNVNDEKSLLREVQIAQEARKSNEGIVEIISWGISQSEDNLTGIPYKRFWVITEPTFSNLRNEILIRRKNAQLISSEEHKQPEKSDPLYFQKEEFLLILETLVNTLAILQEQGISHGSVDLQSIYISTIKVKILLGDFHNCSKSDDEDLKTEEIKKRKYLDQECISSIIQGIQQPRRSALLMDVYALGILLFEVSHLVIFKDHFQFEREKNELFPLIRQRYGDQIADTISFMISKRESRPDFVALRRYWRLKMSNGQSYQNGNGHFIVSIHQNGNNGQNNLINGNQNDKNSSYGIYHKVSDKNMTNGKNSIKAGTNVESDLRSDLSESSLSIDLDKMEEYQLSIEKTILFFKDLINYAKRIQNLKWIEMKDIQIGRQIGSGKFGKTFECSTKVANYLVLKRFLPASISQISKYLFKIERHVMQLFSSSTKLVIIPLFITLLQCPPQQKSKLQDQNGELMLIYPRKRENLRSYVISHKPNLREKLEIARLLAITLDQMHSSNPPILHSNLKFNNILLSIKCTPFFSDSLEGLPSPNFPIISQLQTAAYPSPEQLGTSYHHLSSSSDIYSLALLFCELLFGKQISLIQLNTRRSMAKLDMEEAIYELLAGMTQDYPSKRTPLLTPRGKTVSLSKRAPPKKKSRIVQPSLPPYQRLATSNFVQ